MSEQEPIPFISVLSEETQSELRAAGADLPDDALVKDLKDWRNHRAEYPGWAELMSRLNKDKRMRSVSGTIGTTFVYLMNGISRKITVGDIRTTSAKDLAEADIGEEKKSPLGISRAKTIKDILEKSPTPPPL